MIVNTQPQTIHLRTIRRSHEGRKQYKYLNGNFVLCKHAIATKTNDKAFAFSIHGESTYQLRKCMNLKEKFSMTFKYDHDLPRVPNVDTGYLRLKYDSVQMGWFLSAADVPDVEAAIAGFQKLIDIGFFKSTWTFEHKTVLNSRPDALSIMDTLRNRTGLENHVDLAGLRFAD